MRWLSALVVVVLTLPWGGCSREEAMPEEAVQEQTAVLASRLGVAPEKLRYAGRGLHDGPVPQDIWVLSGDNPDPGAFIAHMGMIQGELFFYQALDDKAALPFGARPPTSQPMSRDRAILVAEKVAAALWPDRQLRVETAYSLGSTPHWRVDMVDSNPTKGTRWCWGLNVKDELGRVTEVGRRIDKR